MKVVRGVFLACIIGGFVVLFLALSTPQRLQEGREEARGLETEEDVLVEGLRFSEWQEGKQIWSMNAERTRYHHKEKKASLDKVEVTFFAAQGGRMRMWAETVDYDLQTKELVARDSVRGKSDQGYDFATESLLYRGGEREVTTDDQVTLEKDRLTIQGTGMQGSLSDHKFRLLSNVRAAFVPQGAVP